MRSGSQPAALRPARDARSEQHAYGARAEGGGAAAAGGGEDAAEVETDKQAQQRRLMSLQVGFWVVVLGLFFGLVVCRGRRRRKGARPRTDLLRSY